MVDMFLQVQVDLLIERRDGFVAEASGVLRAGIETAAWITVDDTGARHKAKNGVCTQIGNARLPGSPPPHPRAG